MHCPICLNTEVKVIDSRSSQDTNSIRRRRKCESCDYRFTTYEKVQMHMPMLIKQDGRREEYSRDKVMHGLSKACEKRPISMTQLEDMLENIERRLCEKSVSEIETKVLGEMVMKSLHDLDPVAFVRFASFYWNYTDIKEFIKGLKRNLNTFEIDIPEQLM